MLGSALAALVVGWLYGRLTERTRRSMKDVIAARTTLDKAMKIRGDHVKKAAGYVAAAVGLLFVLFVALKSGPK